EAGRRPTGHASPGPARAVHDMTGRRRARRPGGRTSPPRQERQRCRPRASRAWPSRSGTPLAPPLVSGIGRRELFNLPAEAPERSVARLVAGAPAIEVVPGGPWAHIPAVLPGP